jgi:hypothetical protein
MRPPTTSSAGTGCKKSLLCRQALMPLRDASASPQAQAAVLAATNKCLATSSKSRTRQQATTQRNEAFRCWTNRTDELARNAQRPFRAGGERGEDEDLTACRHRAYGRLYSS